MFKDYNKGCERFPYNPKTYLAFVLNPGTVSELRRRFPPKFERVLTHHVTLAFGLTEDNYNEVKHLLGLEQADYVEPKVEAFMRLESRGMEAFKVVVNGYQARPVMGGSFHVTHSIALDRHPADANMLFAPYSDNSLVRDYFDQVMTLHGKVQQVPR